MCRWTVDIWKVTYDFKPLWEKKRLLKWVQQHECKSLFAFLQQFAGLLLNHLRVFPYTVVVIFWSKARKVSYLPSGVGLYQDTGQICWDFNSCSLAWDVKHSLLSVFRRPLWLLSLLLAAEEKICLYYSLLGLPPLETAACILSQFFLCFLSLTASTVLEELLYD